MTLVVCPAAALAGVCRERRPSHLIRMASPGSVAVEAQADHRLELRFHDIVGPQPGLIPPDCAAIGSILAFGRDWDGARPLVVSCMAGISRSTAAAFILACARSPDDAETRLAWELRRISPCATPNALMVALADAALGRGGRMIAAIAAIGRGADYVPYTSFDFALDAASA